MFVESLTRSWISFGFNTFRQKVKNYIPGSFSGYVVHLLHLFICKGGNIKYYSFKLQVMISNQFHARHQPKRKSNEKKLSQLPINRVTEIKSLLQFSDIELKQGATLYNIIVLFG